MLFRRSGSELIDTFTNIILLGIFPVYVIDAAARWLGNTDLGNQAAPILCRPSVRLGFRGRSPYVSPYFEGQLLKPGAV
jgi:hypothetical protein